ncbi:MAG: acetyl-CoA carboxylase, carboxyltransferase subunit beta [Lentisphaeria bacterium]|nr:acetyl-CoA carboxylase, carboxyltransferase subunit beta [Lentisphaeria bacterium]
MPLFRKLQYSTVKASKREVPEGLWTKCKGCNTVLYKAKIEENQNVCPECDYHYPITAVERIDLLTDPRSFAEMDADMASLDPLEFAGDGIYPGKLEKSRKKSGMTDAIITGMATLDKRPLALGVMDFRFLGASMGSVVGEKVTRLTEAATDQRVPLVIVTASGGARMYEGMLSLMQMAKTSAALARHDRAGLPYIVIMTHPTTAGVSASFASLGDIILAEPKALIGFAGPRVIEQTTQAKLPEGFQTAEFLVKHGFIDRVVRRADMRKELSLLLEYFKNAGKTQMAAGQ